MTLTGTAVQLPCSELSVQDLQAGTSPWSYLHSSCDGVGMTLYNPIPQLYVSPWLQKRESTAFTFCHTVKTQPPAPRTAICHSTKQRLRSDHSSISYTEILHRNVTLVPTAAISKPGNFTKLQIYTSFQVLPWSRAAATAEWPGLGDLQSEWGTADFPCHSQPGPPPELRELSLACLQQPGFLSWGSKAPQEQCHTLCSHISHAAKKALETFYQRYLLSITKPFATSQH